MQCPRCHTLLVEQTLSGTLLRGDKGPYRSSELAGSVPAHAEQLWVDRCPACKGIWFDGQELNRAMCAMQLLKAPDPPADLSLNSTVRCRCPRCQTWMANCPSRVAPAVVYDRCMSCGGIWLDAGELRCLADPLVALSAFVLSEFS